MVRGPAGVGKARSRLEHPIVHSADGLRLGLQALAYAFDGVLILMEEGRAILGELRCCHRSCGHEKRRFGAGADPGHRLQCLLRPDQALEQAGELHLGGCVGPGDEVLGGPLDHVADLPLEHLAVTEDVARIGFAGEQLEGGDQSFFQRPLPLGDASRQIVEEAASRKIGTRNRSRLPGGWRGGFVLLGRLVLIGGSGRRNRLVGRSIGGGRRLVRTPTRNTGESESHQENTSLRDTPSTGESPRLSSHRHLPLGVNLPRRVVEWSGSKEIGEACAKRGGADRPPPGTSSATCPRRTAARSSCVAAPRAT